MILTVTCNPAVDVTYTVGSLAPGQVHRVSSVVERPGGKGVNVARVLQQLGEATTATGFADQSFGASVGASGVPAAFVRALPKVRRTLVVHAAGETTSLWEPGPAVEPDAVPALERQVAALLGTATALVVSGSLPAGADPSLPARLAHLALGRGVPVVLDLDDEPLRAAANGSGAVLVPNRDELSRLVGADTGLEQVHGNPTGAGDSAAAAIARGLARGDTWPDIVADAVALSVAAVLAPVAGEVVLEAYERWRPQVRVRPVESLPVGR